MLMFSYKPLIILTTLTDKLLIMSKAGLTTAIFEGEVLKIQLNDSYFSLVTDLKQG